MIQTLVLAFVSTAVSVLFYLVGGVVAEVSNESVGLGFRAGGTLAAFVIIFWILGRSLERFEKPRATPVDVRLKVKGKPRTFKEADTYTATCRLRRAQSGEEETLPEMTPRPDGTNMLLLDPIRGVYPDDVIAAVIRDTSGRSWQVKEFVLREPLKDALVVEREAQAQRGGRSARGAGLAIGKTSQPRTRRSTAIGVGMGEGRPDSIVPPGGMGVPSEERPK